MFVRVKRIKGKPYAYLVENEWTPWGSRQRVVKYLGRTFTPERVMDEARTLPDDFPGAVQAAIVQACHNHGFRRDGNTLHKDGIAVNLQENTVTKNGKHVAVRMNEGYLCAHTIQQLLAFQPEERDDDTGRKLAGHMLEAGLQLTDEQFVHLFQTTKKI